jgi:protein CpxP
MNALKTLTLSLALVLGAAAPAVFAQPMMDHGGHGMHRGMGGPGMDGQRLLHMLDDIGASEAQIRQIQAIFKTAREELKAQAPQGQNLHLQMLQLWAAPNIDAAAIDALRKQAQVRHEQVASRMQAAFVEAGRVLTPEQRAKMLERAKKRMERAQRHPGGRDR